MNSVSKWLLAVTATATAAVAFNAIAVRANAQPVEESDRPAASTSDSDDSPRAQRGQPSRALTDEELSDALRFAEEKMPNFYRLWSRMPPERQRRMPPRMQWAFRLMFDAKADGDERLYDLLSQQMTLRDEFMGLRRELMRAEDKEPVRARLLEKVGELVEAGLKQRELRIEKLEKMLAAEKAKLQSDRQDTQKLIESQYRRLDEETSAFAGFMRRYRNQNNAAPRDETPATQPQERQSN